MNEVEEIKARIDIVDHISQYVTLKKAGANYKGVCPFHQEKTPSMMVSPQKQIWKCFGCGKGGDVFAFTMESEHLEFGDALRMLAQKAGVTLQPRTTAEHQTQNRKDRIYRVNMLAAQVFHKILQESSKGEAAFEYLKKRGLKPETLKKFVLGFAPRGFDLKTLLQKYEITAGDLQNAGSPERFYDRVIFPIFDVLGNVIAFTGRALGTGEPKYLNSPETAIFNKGRTLYGLNFAKGAIKEKDYVVLVEGQMDVIALHQAGVQNVVASSGTAITEGQLNTLSKYTQNFLLAFDNDLAGKNTTKKVIELLFKMDLNSKVVDFGEFKDAGELFESEPNQWRSKVKEAKEAMDWLLGQEIAAAGAQQYIENKKKVIKALLPTLALITDETRLDHYVTAITTATQTKTESVYGALQKMWATRGTANSPTAQGSPAQPKVALALTAEEQLLAITLSSPRVLDKLIGQFGDVVWQSLETERIANQVKKVYTNKTLVNDQAQFSSSVKTALDSQLVEKMDSWQFWLEGVWPNLNEALATELAGEKLAQLTTKKREQKKETIAVAIRRAQEAGNTEQVKALMSQLNELTK